MDGGEAAVTVAADAGELPTFCAAARARVAAQLSQHPAQRRPLTMARKAAAALLCLAAAVADAPLSAAVEPTNARSEGIIPAGAMPEQPLPYTEAATGELHKADMQIHGVKITFAVRSWQHLGLLKEHVSREVNGYAIVKDAIESAQKKDPSKVRSQ